MEEKINEIFSQYRVTGRFLGFKYPDDGLKHAICLLIINLIVQVMNTYKHTSIVDGQLSIEGSDFFLTVIDMFTFVIGYWLLSIAHKRYLIKKILRLTEVSLKEQKIALNDDNRLELIRRGCELFEIKDRTAAAFLGDLLRIISLALALNFLKIIIVMLLIL